LVDLTATLAVHLLLLRKILLKVEEVCHLDAVVDWDLESDHGIVEVLGDAEVRRVETRVYHQEIQVGLLHVVLAVEMLKNLQELFEAEPDLTCFLGL